MTQTNPKFTTEEINIRLECLKIAANSVHDLQSHSIPWLADKFYNWLAENQVPTEEELSEFKTETNRIATTSLVFDPIN